MNRLPRLALCVPILTALSLPVTSYAADKVKATRAIVVHSAPTIDGVLDDEQWKKSPKTRGFVERKPTLRGTPPDDTWFAIIVDADAMYIGVWMGDSQASEIRATTTTRDSFAIFSDDALSVKLDPTHDHRTTVGLVMNPAGARMDYRGVNEKDFRVEFDTVWVGKAARFKDGWSVEIAIPWRSLGIDPANTPDQIGLNFSRDHPRRNATYDWALMPPPFRPVSASLYGHINGLSALHKLVALPAQTTTTDGDDGAFADYDKGFLGRNGLAVIPYLLGGFRNAGTWEPAYNAGLDLIWRFASDSRARLTINTDFAQVDVDDQVVNLTRFGLFMPEKREFFVRDVDLFSFGRSGSAQAFYSRRIGLDDDWEPVPILAGTKVVGSLGRTQVGVIEVVTRNNTNKHGNQTPMSGDGVIRALHRFEGGSTFGGIFTHRIRGENKMNFTAGSDFTLRGRKQPLLVEAFALGTANTDGTTTSTSGGGAIDLTWRGLVWRPTLKYAFFERDLDSDLGFFLRTGIHSGSAGLTWEPRFSGVLEKLTVSNSVSSVLEQGGDLLDIVAANTTTLTWKAGWWVQVLADWRRLTAQSDFTLPDGTTTITAGRYDMARAGIDAGTPWVRTAALTMRLRARQYWGGTMLEAIPSFVLRPGGLVRIEGGASLQNVRIGDTTAFTSVLINTRAAIGFTPNLNLDLYAGWNRLFDVFPVQARLRWTWRRASDLFVVYQARLNDGTGAIDEQSLLAKVTVRFP